MPGGDLFDFAAAREIQGAMSEPSVVVPAEYYSSDEAIALIGCADVTVAQRYHFAVESILAETVPVCIVRGQKMESLAGELGLLRGGNSRCTVVGRSFQSHYGCSSEPHAVAATPGGLPPGDARARNT
jgi:polysaccharide pyruvyl transferase WcaK-like protein